MNAKTLFSLALLACICAHVPALAGFKMYIPGQKEPTMIFTDPGANSTSAATPPQESTALHDLAPGQYALVTEQDPGGESSFEVTDSQGNSLAQVRLTPASIAGGATFQVTTKGWYTVKATSTVKFRHHIEPGPYAPPLAPPRPPEPAPPAKPQQNNVDMSGVEWRQSRGLYSGRNSEETKRFGYRAGVYELAYTYNGDSDFRIWMRTRRGQTDQVVNLARPRRNLRQDRLDSDGIILMRTRRDLPRDRIVRSNSGSRAVQLQADDEVFFEVQTDGNWEFTFERIR